MSNNLLLTDFADYLPNTSSISSSNFDRLGLETGIDPIDIKNQSNLDNLDLLSMVNLQTSRSLSPSHSYILDDYEDKNRDPVNLSDYINSSGKVIGEDNICQNKGDRNRNVS